jgi:excisionase family DNA binding protein
METETTNASVALAHKIPDACRRIGCGRTTIYELLASGAIRAIKIGNRTLIPESELQRFVQTRLSEAA